jgi:hypothetical protein
MTHTQHNCAKCKKDFISQMTDEEAEANFVAKYGDIPQEMRLTICDDCYEEFLEWEQSMEGQLTRAIAEGIIAAAQAQAKEVDIDAAAAEGVRAVKKVRETLSDKTRLN